MKKYISAQGYKFKGDYNDMTDKQFMLSNAAYADSESSIYGNLLLDTQETYVLFLKHFEPNDFKTKLQSIINDANADGLCATLGNAIEVERQENGYMITMNFIKRGD